MTGLAFPKIFRFSVGVRLRSQIEFLPYTENEDVDPPIHELA